MQNRSLSELMLIVTTVIVGIGAVWVSQHLFEKPRPLQGQSPPPLQSSSRTPHSHEAPTSSSRQDSPASPAAPPEPIPTKQPPAAVTPSPEVLTAIRSVQQQLEEHERLLKTLQTQIAALQTQPSSTPSSPVATPARPPLLEEQLQELRQKAQEYLTAEGDNTWTPEQEKVRQELLELSLRKEISKEQKAKLQSDLAHLQEKKVNVLVSKALQLDRQSAVQLLTDTLNDKGLTPGQRAYIKDTLKRVRPSASADTPDASTTPTR